MENFYEAALRHLHDGHLLSSKSRYDNAVCLYGFSAECALKSLLDAYCRPLTIRKKYGHRGDDIIRDLYLMITNGNGASILDPALALKLSQLNLPPLLFKDHPERRYKRDGVYSQHDSLICGTGADFLVREMIKQHINGYI